MNWQPIPSRRQEVLMAYADALEADLRRASRLVAGKSFFDGAEFYQPLKALPYCPRAEDVMREGQVPLDREPDSLEARSWSEREEKRREEKERPVPVSDILKQRGGVILGDPGAGKSELLRWAVFERLKTFRKSLMCGETEGLEVPILVRIPLMGAFRETKLRAFHQQVLGRADRLDENELHRVAVLKALHDFAVSREGDMPPPVASTLVRELSRDWQNGRIRPFVALDGWDEVTGEANRRQLQKWLDPLVRREGSFVTSRIVGYEPLELVGGKQEWRLLPLVHEEAENLVQAHLGRTEQSDALCRELRQKPQVATLASNPLALALMVRVFGQRNPVELPRTKSALYREVLHDLLGEPEARRKGKPVRLWEESREAKLEFLETLAWFGYPQVDRTLADFRKAAERLWRRGRLPLELKDALEEHKGNGIQRLLNTLRHDHGLLVPYGKGAYALVHKALLDYLAAAYLARRINDHGFDVEIEVPEDGKVVRVTARHYLDRKVWSPKHQEMIALLGGLVEDTEGLLSILWKEKEDDIFQSRLLEAVSVGGESAGLPYKAACVCEELFYAGWKFSTASREQYPMQLRKPLFTELGMLGGRLRKETQGQWIAKVLDELEEERINNPENSLWRVRNAKALGTVVAGFNACIRAALANRLLKMLEQEEGDSRLHVETLVRIAAGLNAIVSEDLTDRLFERLEAAKDWLQRGHLAAALDKVSYLDGSFRLHLLNRILERLSQNADRHGLLGLIDALGKVGAGSDFGNRKILANILLGKFDVETNPLVRGYIAEALGRVIDGLEVEFRGVLANELLMRLEPEQEEFTLLRLAQALGKVCSGIHGEVRARLASYILERLGANRNAIIEEYLQEVLDRVFKDGLDSGVCMKLADRLLEKLENEVDESTPHFVIDALGRITMGLNRTDRKKIASRLLEELKPKAHHYVLESLVDVLNKLCVSLDSVAYAGLANRLLEKLETEVNESVRRSLVRALQGVSGGLDCAVCVSLANRLIKELETEASYSVRASLFQALGVVSAGLGGAACAGVANRLMKELKTEANEFVRVSLIEALKSVATGLDFERRAVILVGMLDLLDAEKNQFVRREFAWALRRVSHGLNYRDSRVVAVRLMKLLDVEMDKGMRLLLVLALQVIGGWTDEWIRRVLADWILARLEAQDSSGMQSRLYETLRSILHGVPRAGNGNLPLLVFCNHLSTSVNTPWHIVLESELTSLEESTSGSVYGRSSNVSVGEL